MQFHDRRTASFEPDVEEPLYRSAPQNPKDIVCEGSDAEQTPAEIERKRGRYEYHAQRIREGKMPMIQSASLRGPLEEGWVNPWRYRPGKKLRVKREREEERGWWRPGEDMLFTKENVMRRAAAHGKGHLTPVEALKWCREEAAEEASARRSAELARNVIRNTSPEGDVINGFLDEEDMEDQDEVSEVEVMEQEELLESIENIEEESEEDDGMQQPEIPHRYGEKSTHESARSNLLIDTVKKGQHQSRVASYEPQAMPEKAIKRAADFEWLKGSYVSKRARWDSPAAPTPTPILRDRDRKRREEPIKPTLSKATPAVSTSNLKTPNTTWGQDAQQRESVRHVSSGNERFESTMQYSRDHDDVEDIQDASFGTSVYNSAKLRNPHYSANTTAGSLVAPKGPYSSMKTPFRYSSFATSATNGSGLSVNIHGSNSLPQLNQSSDLIEDVSFVTEIAPSSRNLEKFQFRKKKRKSATQFVGLDDSHLEEIPRRSGSGIREDELQSQIETTNHAGSIKYDSDLSGNEEGSSFLSQIPPFVSPECEEANDADSSANEFAPIQDRYNPNYDSDADAEPDRHNSRIPSLNSPPGEFKPIGSTSAMSLKTPLNDPRSIFALDTPVQLSPFAMEYYQGAMGEFNTQLTSSGKSVGTNIIAHAIGVSEPVSFSKSASQGSTRNIPKPAVLPQQEFPSPMVDAARQKSPAKKNLGEGCSVSKNKTSPRKQFPSKISREIELPSQAGSPAPSSSQLTPRGTPRKIGGFTPINTGPERFTPVKQNRRDREETIYKQSSERQDRLTPSVLPSPRLPTPQRPPPEHKVLSTVKSLDKSTYIDDDSTQSWNSTQPEMSKSPIKSSTTTEPLKNLTQSPNLSLDSNPKSQRHRSPRTFSRRTSQKSENFTPLASMDHLQKQASSSVPEMSVEVHVDNPPEASVGSDHEVCSVSSNHSTSAEKSPSHSSQGVIETEEQIPEIIDMAMEVEGDGSPPGTPSDSGNGSWQGCTPQSPQSPWTTVEVAPLNMIESKEPIIRIFESDGEDSPPSSSGFEEHAETELIEDRRDSPMKMLSPQVQVVSRPDEDLGEASSWQPENFPTPDHGSVGNAAVWQPPETSILEEGPAEESSGWQLLQGPATPVNDGIRPMKDFMTPTPSPEPQPNQDELPNTQQILAATTINPWMSAMKKPSSTKSLKRVSFGGLPPEQLDDTQPEASSSSRKRSLSPPPMDSLLQEDEDDFIDDGTNSAKAMAFDPSFLAPDGVGGYRPQLRRSPLKPASSPAVSGMANAFLAADQLNSKEQEKHGLSSQTSSKQPRRKSQAVDKLPLFHNEWQSPSLSLQSHEDENSALGLGTRTIDYDDHVNDIEDNLADFMGEGGILEDWSVEKELKKVTPLREVNSSAAKRRSIFGW